MKVHICAWCRKPWTGTSGWCSCGEYDKDVMIDVVPAATHRGAVDALRELLAAQNDVYASSLSGSGRAPAAIERLGKAMDAARDIVGGSDM